MSKTKQLLQSSLDDCLQANVEGRPIIQYMTDVMAELDRKEVEISIAQTKVGVMKQLCNYFRQVNFAYRNMLLDKTVNNS